MKTRSASSTSTLFRQFRARDALRQLVASTPRAILDKYALSTYSWSGEDRIISELLGNTRDGFYMEAGSCHPCQYSNTYGLYRRGWRGITVDGNEDMVRLHRKQRPNDTAVCAVLSETVRDATFTLFDDAQLSTVCDATAKVLAHYSPSRQRKVQTTTLSRLLDEHRAPVEFGLLSIDVENHDFEVLCGLDLSKYRPMVIAIEMHRFDITRPDESPIYRHLSGHGYRMAGFILTNGYFVRD